MKRINLGIPIPAFLAVAVMLIRTELENTKALSGPKRIVSMFVTIILAVALLPTMLATINDANTDGMDATQLALWGVFGILVFIVIFLAIFGDDLPG